MIVDDFNSGGIAFSPDKAQPPLVVDPDAVLACAVAPQCFKLVARGNTQEVQHGCSVQLLQLAQRNLLNVGKAFDTAAVEQVFSVQASEGQNYGKDGNGDRY